MAKARQLRPIEANTLDEALRRQKKAEEAIEDAASSFAWAETLNRRARIEQNEADQALIDAKWKKQESAELRRAAEANYALAFDLRDRLEAVQRSREAMALMQYRLGQSWEMLESSNQKGKIGRIRRIKTTAQKVEENGYLPPEMKITFDAFVMLVADAIDETGKSAARLAAKSGSELVGSRSSLQAQRVSKARETLRNVAYFIPLENRDTFVQLVGEEVGRHISKPLTLGEIGQRRGYSQKQQASASGGTEVFCVIAMVVHFCNLLGLFSEKHICEMRQNVAVQQENGVNQALLTSVASDERRGK